MAEFNNRQSPWQSTRTDQWMSLAQSFHFPLWLFLFGASKYFLSAFRSRCSRGFLRLCHLCPISSPPIHECTKVASFSRCLEDRCELSRFRELLKGALEDERRAMAGLEESFAQLMSKHSQRQTAHLNHLEKAKKEAFSAATNVSDLLVESVNGGVQESFLNEQRIEMEARALVGTVQRFTKQSVQWLKVFHTFDSALKEIGDFENWIKVMEYDVESIGNALGHLSTAGGNVSK